MLPINPSKVPEAEGRRGGQLPSTQGLLPLRSQAAPNIQAPGVSLCMERSTLQGH